MRGNLSQFVRFYFSQRMQPHKQAFLIDLQQLAHSIANFNLPALLQYKNLDPSDAGGKVFQIFEMGKDQKRNNQIITNISKLGPIQSYIGLSWTAQIFRRLRKNPIDRETYRSNLEQYYEHLQNYKSSQLSVLKAYCHLEDGGLSKMIKSRQIHLLRKWGNSPLTTSHFQSLISTQLFNITDMPVIAELFFQHYFPAVGRLQKMGDIHNSLIYLSNFSKIPYFMPRMLLNVMEAKEQQVQNMSFDEFCETINVLYLLLFKFPHTLSESKLLQPFWKLFSSLNEKYLAKNYRQDQTKYTPYHHKLKLIVQRQKQKLIRQRGLEVAQYQRKLRHHNTGFKSQGSLLQQCVNEQIKELTHLQLEQFREMQNKIEIQLKFKTNRLMMMMTASPFAYTSFPFAYLREPATVEFYQINKCLPDLLLATQIALTRLQQTHPKASFQQYKDIFDNLSSIGLAIDKAIEQNLQQIVQQLTAAQKQVDLLSVFYSDQFQKILWLGDRVERLKKLHSSYCMSDTNLVTFLKHDSRFLVRLLRWNKYHFLANMVKRGLIKDRAVQKSGFGEGLGFKVRAKSGNQECENFLLESQLTKNHVFSSSTIINKSKSKPVFLKGGPGRMLRKLSGAQKDQQ